MAYRPASAALLRVSTDTLLFGPADKPQSLQIVNAGREPLDWRIDAQKVPSWIKLSATSGTVQPNTAPASDPNGDQAGRADVTVSIDPVAIPADEPTASTTLGLETSNGNGNVVIAVANALTGVFRGKAYMFADRSRYDFLESRRQQDPTYGPQAFMSDMQAQNDLGAIDLAFAVKETGGGISGSTRPDMGPLLPVAAPVVGTVNGDDVSFTIETVARVAADPADEANVNPLPIPGAGPVRRKIDFEGKRSQGFTLQGKITETITGLMAAPIRLVGWGVFSYTAKLGADEPKPAQTGEPGSSPQSTDPCAAYGATDGTTLAQTAKGELQGAIPDPRAFICRDPSGAPGTDCTNVQQPTDKDAPSFDYYAVRECSATVSSYCYNVPQLDEAWSKLQCAVRRSPSPEVYGTYLDGLQAKQVYEALQGNDALTKAFDRVWESTTKTPMQEELDNLATATARFGAASDALLRERDQLTQIPSATFTERRYSSLLGGARTSARAALARARLAKMAIRSNDLGRAKSTIRYGLVKTYFESAIIGSLLYGRSVPIPDEFANFRQTIADLQKAHRSLATRLNPLGFEDAYVPFSFDPQKLALGTNNFEQLLSVAKRVVGEAAQIETDALSASRAYKVQAQAFKDQLEQTRRAYDSELADLCGLAVSDIPSTVSEAERPTQVFLRCGESKGRVYDAQQAMKAAVIRLEQAYSRQTQLAQQIRIEEDRLRSIIANSNERVSVYLDTGEKLAAQEIAIGQVQKTRAEYEQRKQRIKSGFGILGAVVEGALSAVSCVAGGQGCEEVAKAIGTIGGAITDIAMHPPDTEVDLANIAAEKQKIQAYQNARIEYLSQGREQIESQAKIKTWLLETVQIGYEVELAKIAYDQESARLASFADQALRALKEQQRANANSVEAFSDATDRLLRDAIAVNSENKFEQALEATFLAARALEYESNVDYIPLRADLFRLRSANAPQDGGGLTAFVQAMESYWEKFRREKGNPQTREDTVSLRRDILKLASRTEFQEVVLDGANRTPDGDLRIRFATSVLKDNGIFSSNVFNDRIKSMRVNLVGARLGDKDKFITVRQEGASFLRAPGAAPGQDDLRTWNIRPWMAIVQSSINRGLSGTPAENPALVNQELAGRSVAFAGWAVVIDKVGEPRNRDLDLSGLEDIELIITHEGYTAQ